MLHCAKQEKADPVTYNFNPPIVQAHWNNVDNNIYLLAQDEDYQKFFKYNIKLRTFEKTQTAAEVTNPLNFANNKLIAGYKGSSIDYSLLAFLVNLRSLKHQILEDAFESPTGSMIQTTDLGNYKGVEDFGEFG